MKVIELETHDLYIRGEYIATFGMLSISTFKCKIDFNLTSNSNPLLQRIVKEIEAIKKEMDR